MNEATKPFDFANANRDHLRAIAAGMVKEPLARRFAQKIVATRDNTIHAPDDVLGERLLRLAALLLAEAQEPGSVHMNVVGDQSRESVLLSIAHQALNAAPYLWSEEVRRQLRAVKSLSTCSRLGCSRSRECGSPTRPGSAYQEPGGVWRVECWARRWGGQAWAWKPTVSTGPDVAEAVHVLLADVYGVNIDRVANELERRCSARPGAPASSATAR